MNRGEAIALLRELVAYNLLDASWVSLERKENCYRVELRSQSYEPLIKYAETNNITIEANKEKDILTIYRP